MRIFLPFRGQLPLPIEWFCPTKDSVVRGGVVELALHPQVLSVSSPGRSFRANVRKYGASAKNTRSTQENSPWIMSMSYAKMNQAVEYPPRVTCELTILLDIVAKSNQ